MSMNKRLSFREPPARKKGESKFFLLLSRRPSVTIVPCGAVICRTKERVSMAKENEQAYGDDYVVITDEDGQEYELELLDSLEVDGREYRAFLPVSEDDEEPYEMILFRVVEEDGEELLEVIDDDDEMERVYARFMERLFDEDEDED